MIRRALPGALLVLFLCAAYADPLLTRDNFGGRDILAYNLPMDFSVHDAWARGRLPVWTPEISGGRPLLPNPNVGAFYPVRALLSIMPFPVAMRIFPVLHWILAAVGVLCLLRVLGASRSASCLAAMTYAFSGVVVSEAFFPHYMPCMAALPWILFVIARPAPPARKILPLSLLFGLELLSGDVFQIPVSIGSAALWIFVETRRPAWKREFAALGFALAGAALLAAPQVVATALWIPESERAVSGMKLSESLLFSLPPLRLIELAVPYPFGSTFALDPSQVWARTIFHRKALGLFATLYCGAFAAVAAVWMLRRRAPGSRFSRVLLFASLALAVLPSLAPAAWGSWSSPLALRNPEKFAVGIVFALALLSGLAFDRMRSAPAPRRAVLAVSALLCVLAVVGRLEPAALGKAAMALAGESSGSAANAGQMLSIALAEAGLLWAATFLAIEALSGLPSSGGPVALALLVLVPVAANRRIARTFPEDAVFAPTPFARFLSRQDPRGDYRALGAAAYRPISELERIHASNDPGRLEFSRRNWTDSTPLLWRRGLVLNRDFDVGDFSRLQSLRRLSFLAARYSDSQAFFGALSLRWAIRFRDQEPLPGYHRVRSEGLMDWDEHERAEPDIRLLTRWREASGALEALGALRGHPTGEIAIESGRSRQSSARSGEVRVLEKSPERLLLETRSPDPTWLFVLRGFWTHRTVELDGRPVEDFPAQLAFSAIPVPAGSHRVEWRERVPGGTISRWGPVLYVLAALAGIARLRRTRRRA